jgi:endonuclease YncB( thermonuclease family)
MNTVLRSVFCGGLLYSFTAFALHAQDSAAKPQVTLDYSNDPCGNPMNESQLWRSVRGNVSQVIDGRTLLVRLPHNGHLLRVFLVGVSLENQEQVTVQTKELLSQLLLGKPIEILVNSSWDFADKKPTETTGVVHLKKSMAGVDDVGLLLLSKGLVKFQKPAPYSMSRYAECQYKRAEAEGQSKKLGIWAKAATD